MEGRHRSVRGKETSRSACRCSTKRRNETEGGEEEKTCRYEDDGFLGKRFERGHEVVDAGGL